MNFLKKISNISLIKTIFTSFVLATIAVFITQYIAPDLDDIEFLILLIFLPILGGIPILILIFKIFAHTILYLIGGFESIKSKNEDSDFFKSKEIEAKEVVQKATQKIAKDLEEDLFE